MPITSKPRPELTLLLTIARVDLSPGDRSRLRELIAGEIDWTYLLGLADRHGLQALLFHHIHHIHHIDRTAADVVPAEVMNTLREDSKKIAKRNFILASSLQRISAHFRSRKIEHIWYKGPLMAETYYGNCALRESRDLDVIVPRARLADARDALGELGFSDKYGLRAGLQALSFRFGFEHPFTAQGGIDVDLHCRVVQKFKARAIDMEGIWRRATMARLVGQEAPTFCPEDLLIALCLHAGHHGWMQLSHLCDIAQVLLTHPELDWETVCSHLGDSNTRRMAYLSWHLVHRHWDARIPVELMKKIDADQHVARLAHRIETEIWPSLEPALTTSNLRWLLDRTAGEDIGDRVHLLAGSFFYPAIEDFENFRLPVLMAPLYPGLRFLRLMRNFTYSLWQT